MGTSFTWGFPDETMPASPEEVRADQQAGFESLIRESLRSSAASSYFPPQNADATAQNSGGLGIQNVKRGLLNLCIQYDSSVVGVDFQTSSTSFVDVSTQLTGQMASSGRPVMIIIRGTSTGDACTFTARVDTAEVTGVSAGIVTSARGNGIWVTTPEAGTHTYAMQWKVASGTAVMPRSFRPALTVVEL